MGLTLRGLLALLLCLASAPAARADADALEAAWRAWAAETDVGATTLAVTRGGGLVRELGIGRDPQEPVPLASLSKSITGLCVMALARQGRLGTQTTVGQVLGPFGVPMTPGAARITVAELLTHTSGIDRDSTQGHPGPWRARGGDRTADVTRTALSRDPGAKRFAYNNENYAILGTMIAAVTDDRPARVCPRILRIDASISAAYGGGVSWGGYEMSAANFAIFAAQIRPAPDWPRADLGGGISYGPGVMFKDGPRGPTLWHFGSWCFVLGRSSGAYFFQLSGGWGVTVAYDRCLTSRQTRALDSALAAALD